MSSGYYPSAISATFTATLKNDDGTAIPYDAGGTEQPRISTLTLNLTDAASGSVVNSRSSQEALNTNNVTVDSAGVLTWLVQVADLTPLSSASDIPLVEHLALFTWTYVDDDGNTKTGKHEHRMRIRNASPLCLYEDVLQQIEIDDEDREFVEMLIDQVTARFEDYCDRKFREATFTQDFSPANGQRIFRVRRYPISSMTAVYEDWGGDFDDSDALESDAVDASTHATEGVFRLRYRDAENYPGSLRFVGVGGYKDPAAVPYDLRMVTVRQVAYLYQRRRQLGESGISMDGRSVSLYATDLLDDVKAVLNNHRPRLVI